MSAHMNARSSVQGQGQGHVKLFGWTCGGDIWLSEGFYLEPLLMVPDRARAMMDCTHKNSPGFAASKAYHDHGGAHVAHMQDFLNLDRQSQVCLHVFYCKTAGRCCLVLSAEKFLVWVYWRCTGLVVKLAAFKAAILGSIPGRRIACASLQCFLFLLIWQHGTTGEAGIDHATATACGHSIARVRTCNIATNVPITFQRISGIPEPVAPSFPLTFRPTHHTPSHAYKCWLQFLIKLFYPRSIEGRACVSS